MEYKWELRHKSKLGQSKEISMLFKYSERLNNLSQNTQSQWGIEDWTPECFPFTTLPSSSIWVMAQQLAEPGAVIQTHGKEIIRISVVGCGEIRDS